MQVRKILLVGTSEQRKAFTNKICGYDLDGANLEADYTETKILINGIKNHFIIYEHTFPAVIYKVEAVIYLCSNNIIHMREFEGASYENPYYKKEDIERTRIHGKFDEMPVFWRKSLSRCIAINYYSLNITPIECLEKIDSFIEFNEELNKTSINKSILVMAANKEDLRSCFYILPKEISLHISSTLFYAQKNQINKHPFDALPQKDTNMRQEPLGIDTLGHLKI